jgi:hypothetical protein
MKKTIIAISFVTCLFAFCISDSNNKVFKKLYALEGTWEMITKNGTICEEWKKIDNNYLQGKGYTTKGSDTIINEKVALKNADAGIFYLSSVANQNNRTPISFRMTKAEGNQFIFENPNHDFPKRIVYKLINVDSLQAFVDDGIDGSENRQDFYYKKVK